MHDNAQQQLVLPKGVTVRDPMGDRYAVVGLLGKGTIGVVYLVRDRQKEEKLYALKEVSNPDRRDRERFLFEGEILKRLHHPALPHVYRVFENQKLKRVYMLMDYVQGKNLEALRLEQQAQLCSLPLVLTLMMPIVNALAYLHQQEPPIVHRDIKPANIIVPINGSEAMLVDFGSAKEYMADTTIAISHKSPGYAAPEQYGSGTTIRTDIYGLGATLYTMLTGVVPADALSRIAHHINGKDDPLQPPHVLVSHIPLSVSEVLQRALSINSAERFESVQAFWSALHSYTSTQQSIQPPHVPSADVAQPLPKTTSSRKRVMSIAIFIYSVLLLVIVLERNSLFGNWWLTVLLLYCVGGLLLTLVVWPQRRR